MRIVAVVGEPASGKTSLVRALLAGLGPYYGGRFGLLRYREYPEARLMVLGDYAPELPWPGTDIFDERARAYLRLLLEDGHEWLPADTTLLWEGLLFVEPLLLETARCRHDLTLVRLQASDATLEARYAARANYDYPHWLPQLRQRLDGYARDCRTVCLPSETDEDQRRNLERLRGLLGQ